MQTPLFGTWVAFDPSVTKLEDLFIADDETAAIDLSRYRWSNEAELLEQARAIAHQYKKISTTYLQVLLRIGYSRAVRLAEALKKEMGEYEAFI